MNNLKLDSSKVNIFSLQYRQCSTAKLNYKHKFLFKVSGGLKSFMKVRLSHLDVGKDFHGNPSYTPAPCIPVSLPLSPMATRHGSSSSFKRMTERLKPCNHKSMQSRQGPTVLTPVRHVPHGGP